MGLFSLLCHMNNCGPQNGASFIQFNESGILTKLNKGIVNTASLHPSTIPVLDKIEQKVREGTAMYEDFIQ